MTKTMRLWAALGMALLMAGLIAGCGAAVGAESLALPTLAPTMTALPPVTPTDYPASEPIALPEVDWDDVAKFEAAMRPAFAQDVYAFADRNRYYIEASLRFEDDVAVLTGAQRVRYTNHSSDTLNEIVFRLYPNLPALGGRMIVYQTEVDGAPVEPVLSERESVMTLPLAEPLAPGEAVEMAMQFTVTAERGMFASYGAFGYQNNVFSAPEWYPVLSVYEEGFGWWTTRPSPAGDAVYSESGLYEVFLTVPETFTVAASGTTLETFPVGNGLTTHHIVSGPMRDSLIVAGPEFGVIRDSVDDIAVNVYFWPGDESAAEWVMDISLDSMRVFNEAFGPYPFAEVDVVETFNYTGIEYPGIVIIADRNWERGNAFLEVTTAHELAHQWWYSLVGNNQVEHPWLDESLTAFSEYLYMREVYGEQRARDQISSDRNSFSYYRSTGAPDLPLNLPVTAYRDNNYGMIIYVKGPLFYAELERQLGTERFLEALQLYYERHRYEIVESADVLAAFEDATGEDLDALFYEWVGEFEGLTVPAQTAAGSS
jgi:hypothetical protein